MDNYNNNSEGQTNNLYDWEETESKIKVFGIGGGGGNAIEYMNTKKIDSIDLFNINTDIQALKKSSLPVENRIQIGRDKTRGLGAGANPNIGQESAMESADLIREHLLDTDMLFLTAGMGGGTGTGAAPVIGELAKEMGVLSVAVVTKPFSFEGKKRTKFADIGIGELEKSVDSVIVIPNDKLISVLGRGTTLQESFNKANDVLVNAVQGITDLIVNPGLINVDFADVKAVMSNGGASMMGIGFGMGEDRAKLATNEAIESPLLEGLSLSGASGLLVNISSGANFNIGEFEEIGNILSAITHEDATIVIGSTIDEKIEHDGMRITIVATGLGSDEMEEEAPIFSSKNEEETNELQFKNLNEEKTEKTTESFNIPSYLQTSDESK